MPSWDLLSVGAKFLGLSGMAGVLGGTFCLYLALPVAVSLRRRLLSYILAAAVMGLLGTGLFFLGQVGAINQSGWRGMWDAQMIAILATTGLGKASGLRLLGFLAALGMVAVLWLRYRASRLRSPCTVLALSLFAAAGVLLGISFPLTGHVATLDALAQAAIVLHVLSVSLWIGALYPLWLLCGLERIGRLERIMRRFGWMATFIVALLILSGLYLSVQLLDSLAALVNTAYGRSLLLKLLGVSGLLALAALHRFILVPGLGAGRPAGLLRRSILVETGLALVVLAITAYVTTVVDLGPG